VRDAAGRLRLLSPAMVRGMIGAPRVRSAAPAAPAAMEEEPTAGARQLRALRGQIMAARRARLIAAAESAAAAADAANGEIPPVQPAEKKKPARKPAAAAAAAPGAPKFPEAGVHLWGTVYNPALDKRNKPAVDPSADPAAADPAGRLWGRPLTAEGRREFGQYAALANEVTDVPDPAAARRPVAAEDLATDGPWVEGRKADGWWDHDHAGRGY